MQTIISKQTLNDRCNILNYIYSDIQLKDNNI